MDKLKIIIAGIFVGFLSIQSLPASGQHHASIIDTLSVRSGGRIVVNQMGAVENMMSADTVGQSSAVDRGDSFPSTTITHKAGYRIQVYSDSKQRTAKANVERIASQISGAFPTIGTYTTFKAPYWRLKVGDFQTREDAVDFMQTELKKAFPSLAGEMIIVRDRINVIE